ncbi:hypothetical protein HK102_006550, partial [Quaeritorhiza haematococci]
GAAAAGADADGKSNIYLEKLSEYYDGEGKKGKWPRRRKVAHEEGDGCQECRCS